MLIDDHKKFIFVHVPRTGGFSAYQMLANCIRPPGPLHIARREIQNKDTYFSFGFVRNPWRRIYSCWKRSIELEKWHGMSFREFVLKGSVNKTTGRSAFYFLDGCSYAARFENIEHEWDLICKSIGVKRNPLPHIHLRDSSNYRAHYDDELKDYIRLHHAWDIEFGEYEF